MNNAAMDEFVNRVRERSDIHDVVARYVQLHFKGGRYWACCPFHEEKTASFTITPEKGLFYCFGCHAGGNVFKFISMMENISYFDAVKLQAERLGIELPSRNKSPAELRAEKSKKSLLKATALAREFYHNHLTKTAAGETGRKYLAARGITQGVIESFKLGMAPDAWDSLAKALRSRGYTDSELIAAGLAVERQNGSGVYDRLRGRIIIPIADVSGRVVAFGGRILNSEDENNPKYLNTPETEIFSKGRLLFGLDKSSRAISAKNSVVVVEGYMDAISLASAGIDNVVATLGTAFTAEHAKLLTRYARRVIFCYDSDEAGQRATIRALSIISDAGAEVSVIVVPDGKDPDEFVRKHGKDAFERLIANATPLIDYRINYVLARAKTSTINEKLDAVDEILPALVGISDNVVLQEHCRRIADALFLDESQVNTRMNKLRNTAAKNPAKELDDSLNKSISADSNRNAASENPLIVKCGSTIIRMAWYEDDVLEYALDRAPKEIFTKLHQEIISYLENCKAEERRPDDLDAAKKLSAEANVEVSRILNSGSIESRDVELVAFEDSVRVMRRTYLKSQHSQFLREAERYFKSGDESAYLEAVRKSLNLKKEMDEL